MTTDLNNHWIRLEKLKQRFEQAILDASPEQQQFNPGSNSWNMLQVLQHLIVAEKLSMDYLISKNYSNARKGGRAGAFVRSLFLRFMLQSPLRFKAPRILQAPDGNPEPAGLLQEWKQVREAMYDYLDRFPEEKMAMMIYRHPRAGWLTIQQALSFFEDHITHHQQQLQRLRQAPEFPA